MTTKLGDLLLSCECDYLSPAEIEAWVEGQLPMERRSAWEVHAESCGDCSELIGDLATFESLSGSGLTVASEKKAFEQSDARVRLALGIERKRRRLPRGFTWWGLRSVAFAAIAASLMLFFWPLSSNFLIAEIETIPFQPPPAVRGDSVQLWNEAANYWERKEYASAARTLEKGLRDDPDQADLAFYLGLSRLYAGDSTGATTALLEAERLQAEIPSETTRWMLATALDRAGNQDEACRVLRSISIQGGVRAARAEELVAKGCR